LKLRSILHRFIGLVQIAGFSGNSTDPERYWAKEDFR
jgi:hypothetical protein